MLDGLADALAISGDAFEIDGATAQAPKTTFVQTVATFVDANPWGTASDFTASIDWGDGHVSAGTVSSVGGGFAVTGSHRYESKGPYPVAVHVADVGGSTTDVVSSATVTGKG